MTLKNKLLYVLIGFVLLSLVYPISNVTKAAISSFTPSNCYTAAATTTLSYMTPGTATTTTPSCLLGPDGANSAVLAVEVNASSTLATFNVYAEESMDGIDWFPITSPQAASSTIPFSATLRAYTSFIFASSTVGGGVLGADVNGIGVNGTQNRNHYLFEVPTRMRYIRAYAGITGANGAIWMNVIPRQPIN